MAIKKKAPILDELDSVENNMKKGSEAEAKHNENAKSNARKKDPERNIYKNIKVSQKVENAILDVIRARRLRGEKGSTFDSVVYEAIINFLDEKFETETGEKLNI